MFILPMFASKINDDIMLLMTQIQPQNNIIFWIETEKISPNPFQPRKEFNDVRLQELAESIRQYGILQPLVVTRKEIDTESGMNVEYELIAGERRLRAAKIANLFQVPVIIKEGYDDKARLELAIIENLQREDLNPIEKARAFKQLAVQFNMTHKEIGEKVGKSRMHITNTIRILNLSDEILNSLGKGEIYEGHTRPLLMLIDHPEKQKKLFQDIVAKKVNVGEAEQAARRIAQERVRRTNNLPDPETRAIEDQLSDELGTRVQIEKIGEKGKIVINFFSREELDSLLKKINQQKIKTKFAREPEQEISISADDEEEILGRFTI